jgi:uncharacterized protein
VDANEITVIDDADQRRFLVSEDGVDAELVYRADGNRLVLVHTEVPEEFRGRGVGGRLVAAAVDRARSTGEVVVPRCPYARRWLREHPEAVEGVVLAD